MKKLKVSIFSLTQVGDGYLPALKGLLEADQKNTVVFKESDQFGGENCNRIKNSIKDSDLSILFCDGNDSRMWHYVDWAEKFEKPVVLIHNQRATPVVPEKFFAKVIPLQRVTKAIVGHDYEVIAEIDNIIRN